MVKSHSQSVYLWAVCYDEIRAMLVLLHKHNTEVRCVIHLQRSGEVEFVVKCGGCLAQSSFPLKLVFSPLFVGHCKRSF